MKAVLDRALREVALTITEVGKPPWLSLDIDYEEPRVERLWRPFEVEYRVSLHCIHECKEGKPLFHPHPWPSAMIVLGGTYEMNVGYGEGDIPPPVATTVTLASGSSYEMIEPNGWHSVNPQGETWTLMVSGKPWGRTSPQSTKPLNPLAPGRIVAMRQKFTELFFRNGLL